MGMLLLGKQAPTGARVRVLKVLVPFNSRVRLIQKIHEVPIDSALAASVRSMTGIFALSMDFCVWGSVGPVIMEGPGRMAVMACMIRGESRQKIWYRAWKPVARFNAMAGAEIIYKAKRTSGCRPSLSGANLPAIQS